MTRRMLWAAAAVLMAVSAIGCFEATDLKVDRTVQKAIGDQKLMAAQDEAAERKALEAARDAGLVSIETWRQKIGRSLEGYKGPDDQPLLNWTTAMQINGAFDQLQSQFLQAVAGQEARIVSKYAARNAPIAVQEKYLEYIQTRRHVGDYAAQAFMAELVNGGSVGAGPPAMEDVIGKLQGLGLPTSINELSGWLQNQAGSLLTSALSGASPDLAKAAPGLVKLLGS